MGVSEAGEQRSQGFSVCLVPRGLTERPVLPRGQLVRTPASEAQGHRATLGREEALLSLGCWSCADRRTNGSAQRGTTASGSGWSPASGPPLPAASSFFPFCLHRETQDCEPRRRAETWDFLPRRGIFCCVVRRGSGLGSVGPAIHVSQLHDRTARQFSRLVRGRARASQGSTPGGQARPACWQRPRSPVSAPRIPGGPLTPRAWPRGAREISVAPSAAGSRPGLVSLPSKDKRTG